ncbi:MAG: PaaI family thioesterase [Coriobacteriia bacterium]|nr:PaaI family thioesterase [Coriobacteriia bacterium]
MRQRVLAAQNISRMCVVCGIDNDMGLHARFYELENGELFGIFAPLEHHQGYPGRLHGGIASTILDEMIGRTINISDHDVWGVTVELSVRFRKPVPLNGEIRAIGRITKNSRRLFEGTGEIVLEDGTVAVQASGRYMKMPIERIADGDFGKEWFADERERPDEVEF